MKFLRTSRQISSQQEHRKSLQERSPLSKGIFWAARTRILFWYVLIIVFIFAVSIPLFHHLLYQRVDARVRGELIKKMMVFNKLIGNPISDQLQDEETSTDRRK